MSLSKFPHEIVNVTENEDKIIKKYYKNYNRAFVRVGPSGYLHTPGYADHASDLYDLEIRADDVWVTSFVRSGTTWLEELVWLVNNNLDYQALKDSGVNERFAFIEYPTYGADISNIPLDPSGTRPTIEDFRTLPNLRSPRYIKTHLALSLLPPALLDTAKVLYVARDPRDVVVSSHFLQKMFRFFDDDVTIKEYWDLFKNNLSCLGPIFSHIKEAWNQRSHSNLLFLFYEDMIRDLLSCIDRVCTFLGKEYTEEQKKQLAQHLNFENMKKNSPMFHDKENDENSFFRKGKAGAWVQYFDEEMRKEAEEYMAKNLADTDLRFPEAQ